MPQTIEQQRAARAWEHVGDAPTNGYVSLTQGAPVHIHTSGLGQTAAFYLTKAKDGNEYDALLKHLAEWLLRQQPGPKNGQALMQTIQSGDTQAYRRLASEAIAYLAWLKRFAKARSPQTA